jgi:predicted RNase H-like HicB family nuclease
LDKLLIGQGLSKQEFEHRITEHVGILAGEGETIGSSKDAYSYTPVMAEEDTVLEEAMDNLKDAAQRIRATQSLMRSHGMPHGEDYRDLLTRLSTALAMTEAAYLEARRRRDL